MTAFCRSRGLSPKSVPGVSGIPNSFSHWFHKNTAPAEIMLKYIEMTPCPGNATVRLQLQGATP